MDETEPLTDEVLAAMEARYTGLPALAVTNNRFDEVYGPALVSTEDQDSDEPIIAISQWLGDQQQMRLIVALEYMQPTIHILITEVRRLRAERVRWEALRVAATNIVDAGRQIPYEGARPDDWQAVHAALDALAT